MPRSWPYVTTPRTSGTPLKILISFFGALLLALLAAEQRPSLDCGPCDATAYVSLIPDTALALLALTLCAYASWLTLIQMRQARAADRLLESQSLLASFARAFDDAQTRGEFIQVATRVLADYAGYFGADSLRVEIVEPRTGVTVDEFLAPRFPPAIGPEVKAYFLKQNPAGHCPEPESTPRFLDLGTEGAKWFGGRRTREVAAAITTPLGRTAILLMIFAKPRRAFRDDEVDHLCSSLSGLVQTAADHCKRKNREDLERRLNHAERVQAVGTLAGGVAHEFNNILGALFGYGEMALQRAQDGKEVEHYLHEMLSTARRAELIVSQILTLSRSREQKRLPLNLVEAMHDALPLISASFPELEVAAPRLPDEDCKILGHPMDLQQVLMNLCKNALEAASGSVKIEIDIEMVLTGSVKSLSLGLLQPGKYVRLRVEDNGRGMSAETLPRIFEPFFTTRGALGGTGLGLAAVHGLVTAMDGRIDVTSERDKGTLFEIYFPHCSMPSIPINQFFASPRLVLGSGELIATLKVPCGDHALHEERIAALGYEPVSLLDYAALETWLTTRAADLIMIDIAAVPAGVSARDIEVMVSGTPVIVTSRFGEESLVRAINAGHFTQLREPISTRALADAIRTSIQGKPERHRPIVLNDPSPGLPPLFGDQNRTRSGR
ncbi:MAG: ATP-binding protein [Alphaproteobacteria bacterium]|nr:ATP-binding protein [Alphaproteobacteria bacterium]MBU1552796.1 ATP-binding protein [Alphaproteobacteria bacterium]MBU2337055.1 ATP-binding protein [Alphaproteobacteria bacterium]MBU2389065.1 ATP-binding protein [Alphaproteobacteria bacterium]